LSLKSNFETPTAIPAYTATSQAATQNSPSVQAQAQKEIAKTELIQTDTAPSDLNPATPLVFKIKRFVVDKYT